MMLKPYTVNDIAQIIQSSIDNANDDKDVLRNFLLFIIFLL